MHSSCSAFCPFNFQGNDSRFLEIGGTNFVSDKRKCRVENDVIELGEEGDTQI